MYIDFFRFVQNDKDWQARRSHKMNKQELLALQATINKELEVSRLSYMKFEELMVTTIQLLLFLRPNKILLMS